ncbi:MAG: AAA family ATPase [Erysipelothrix sp.]|nr:AAA family ATPase [Erysipelothrix sp.]
MFLKKIEMQGFKSFADKVVISFDDSVTGVVGPNGCGKSNISDAIRWVLGEQSVKSMRGSSMTDVIFNGSETRKKVNIAAVTLVFNNENKFLNSDYEEVEVTRKLYRDTRESEYFINKVACRLRDIHDLVLDTGLGRDSLSIISQGSISFFAEARPIDRRVIFEEAAGVAKYKRRKVESIRKLERTQENVERMQDITEEIGKQVAPLKRAALKAESYNEKRAALEQVEVSVLVDEIQTYDASIHENNQEIYSYEATLANVETRVSVYEHELETKRQDEFKLDQEINKSQEKMMQLVREIGILETRKIEIDEKRKYTIEVGNVEEKAKEVVAQLNQAKLEYEDRQKRHAELKAETEFLLQSTQDTSRVISQQQQSIRFIEEQKSKLNDRLNILNHRLSKPFEANIGVQTIMNNKDTIFGIHDVISNLFVPLKDYDVAINTTLAGANMHIVTQDSQAAVSAINFLKRNRSGRATFIPLNVVKPRYVNRDALTVCEHAKGFLGLASDFVESDEKYFDLRDSLLGNVVIVDSIENANVLSKRLNYNYRIVTLEGDVIHTGGRMTGGGVSNSNNSTRSLRIEVENIEKQNLRYDVQIDEAQLNLETSSKKYRQDNETLMQKRIALAQIEPLLDVKRAAYESLQSDYDSLETDKSGHEDIVDEVVSELNKALMERDELTSGLSLARERRLSISQELQRKELEIRELRKQDRESSAKLNELNLKNTRFETNRDNAHARLSSEYQMTFEYALENIFNEEKAKQKEDVLRLRTEIQKLGNVNLDAPAEYQEVNERFEFLSKQLNELVESRELLLNVISELDEIMEVQFKEMFDKINNELQDVFAKLFNGGRARLVLEDPNDLLNTGIDIDVQPPGKSVQNIRLFSGGEKSLIAISVLFAIIKARTVPLCIFDEVEAALDAVNVDRLANYIKELSNDDTQFILITHRPGTMAKCDILYGVTMPTKGVSSLLSVKLDEAIQLKEEVPLS